MERGLESWSYLGNWGETLGKYANSAANYALNKVTDAAVATARYTVESVRDMVRDDVSVEPYVSGDVGATVGARVADNFNRMGMDANFGSLELVKAGFEWSPGNIVDNGDENQWDDWSRSTTVDYLGKDGNRTMSHGFELGMKIPEAPLMAVTYGVEHTYVLNGAETVSRNTQTSAGVGTPIGSFTGKFLVEIPMELQM